MAIAPTSTTPIATTIASLTAGRAAPTARAAVEAPVAARPAAAVADAPAAAINSPNASVATGYDPNPVMGGGAISEAVGSAISRLAATASNGMKRLENQMNGDLAANGGQVDPLKVQQYTQQMSTFEMIMQMAAKIQEKQERAAQIWLQR